MIEAVIRLAEAFCGISVPKVSCMILPIAPTGVMSDSPVARQATSASRKVISTATSPSRKGTLKAEEASHATPMPLAKVPSRNQLLGGSVAARSSSLPLPPSFPEKPVKARTMVFHCSRKARMPEDTMIETPSQSPCSFQTLPALEMATISSPLGLTQVSVRPLGPTK